MYVSLNQATKSHALHNLNVALNNKLTDALTAAIRPFHALITAHLNSRLPEGFLKYWELHDRIAAVRGNRIYNTENILGNFEGVRLSIWIPISPPIRCIDMNDLASYKGLPGHTGWCPELLETIPGLSNALTICRFMSEDQDLLLSSARRVMESTNSLAVMLESCSYMSEFVDADLLTKLAAPTPKKAPRAKPEGFSDEEQEALTIAQTRQRIM